MNPFEEIESCMEKHPKYREEVDACMKKASTDYGSSYHDEYVQNPEYLRLIFAVSYVERRKYLGL